MNALIAAITIGTLVEAIVWLIVAGLIFYLLNWALTACGTPEPFLQIGKVIIILAAVVLVINALLLLVGQPFIRLR